MPKGARTCASLNAGAPSARRVLRTAHAQGFFLTSDLAGFASWPVNTEVTITFELDSAGAVSVPSINGEPFQEVNWEDRASFDEFGTRNAEVPWIPGCKPLTLHTDTALYVGRADANSAFDDFQGAIAELSIDYVPTISPPPPPPPSPSPPPPPSPSPPPPPSPSPPPPPSPAVAVTCTAGSYDAGTGSCVLCSPGTYSGSGATSCSGCPGGTWSGTGWSNCASRGVCNAGYYDVTFGGYRYWGCGSGCPGGSYYTDWYCNCACRTPSQM
jgi:hypothetical protein